MSRVLSKAKIKFIKSLEQRKFRKKENAFVAEGYKSMEELLRAGFHARLIVATEEWENPCDVSAESAMMQGADTEVIRVTDEELRKVSFLQHPQLVLGVFEMPEPRSSRESRETNGLVLALDGVQDPGNLGTIIRTADWFGVDEIVCSPLTADAYSPRWYRPRWVP